MSSLYKLSIKGIRAFEPEQEETIQFGFPLTLICGQNGCGKTTIIECLKYATTGDLPPNSKGGAFVNDPTISGRGNVTGQVKLAFRNANGKSMIITRTVQLTRKKGRNGVVANTFKSLEGQLLIIQGGEKVSVSSKNAELDAQTPIYLGASRAVLDFVLFCHQDDSLWPLSEASVLKKRFDDIFEASKYTKVLENLKVIRKDMAVNIKLMEHGVDHLKLDKDRAEKVKSRLHTLATKADQYTADLESITLEIDRYEREANDLFSLNQDFQATLVQHDRLFHEQKLKLEQAERLRNSIEELPDSYQVLLEKQENFDKYTHERKSELNATKESMSVLEEEFASNANDHNTLLRLEGSLKAKEAENAANAMKMGELIAQFSSALGVPECTFTEFGIAIRKDYEQRLAEITSLKSTINDEKKRRQLVLQGKADAITRTQQNCDNQNQIMDREKQKLADLKKKLLLAANTGGEIEFKQTQLRTSENKFKLLKESSQLEHLQSEKVELEHKLTALDDQSDDLALELVTSTEHAGLIASIQSKEETISGRGMAMRSLVESTSGEFEATVGSKFDIETCEQVLSDAISSSTSQLRSIQEQLMQLAMKLGSIKSMIESNAMKLEKMSKSKEACLASILEAIDKDEIDTYDQVLADLELSSRNVAEDINTFEVTKQFNETAIKTAETLGKCLMCRRSFEGSMLQTFINELKATTKEDRYQEIEKQAKQIDHELTTVRAIGPRISEYHDLMRNIEELTESTRDLEAEYVLFEAEESTKSKQLADVRAKCDLIDSLRKPVSEISRIQREINSAQSDLSQLRQEIEYYGTAIVSAADLQKQQQSIVIEAKAARRKLMDIEKSIASFEKTQSIEAMKIKDIQLEVSKLEQLASDVGTLRASIAEVEASIQNTAATSEALQRDLIILKKEKARLQDDYEKYDMEKRQVIDSSLADTKETEELLENVELLARDMSHYETHILPQLKENTQCIDRSLTIRSELSARMQQLSHQVRRIEQELSAASQTRHNIMANLDYRALTAQLSEIEEKLSGLDIENAHNLKEQYQASSRDLRDKLAALNATHAGKTGELKQIRDQVKSLLAELETDFKNVGSRYHEEWIKLQTNMLVSNDISTYQQALDNAIMKFHSLKMASINRILGELWSLTYKGTDIESIAIKSDYSVQTKGNRSYNYRVVMYKSGNELDMRGRCSAGQKVLTSILIRLALAECFGVNCGMIALDEPTTNLDQENAESLAEALNQIIEVRKQQQNFQLIVITHDENFLMHMNGDKFADHFYRVMRDELQSSRIYSLPIHKIQEA